MSRVDAVQRSGMKRAQTGSYALLLQRKCGCGSAAGLTGECTECRSKKLLGKPLPTKIRINEPGDDYEREADRVAEQVMSMPDATVYSKTSLSGETPLVQRRVSGNDAVGIGTAPSIVQDVLSSPGQPLDGATRAFFQQRFGHDFGQVRIHADDRAARSAQAVNASAYTVGQNIVFGPGRFESGSRAGRQLLAHELTHVVQQSSATDAMPKSTRAARLGVIQRQPEAEPPTFPDFPGLFYALEKDVGKNLRDYGHHLYRASILHPDEPQYLENALSRYALGLNVLKTSYRFAGLEPGTADKLALGTGILVKGLNFVREGEFVLDFQIDIGKGLKLEANLDLGVNPDKFTEVRKTQLGLGLVGEF